METKEIEFYGDKLTAVKGEGGKTYVALRQVVENLGLDYKSQHRKVVSNPFLNSTVVIMTMVAEDGKNRDITCLPAEMIPGFILTLNINKLSSDLQPKVMRYAKEAYKVLAEVFMGPGFATNPNPERVDLEAMKAKAEALAVKRHELMMQTTERLLEWNPNYSRTTLSRMVEVSARTNLQGELVMDRVVLDVSAFLQEQGLSATETRKLAAAFGKSLKQEYIRRTGQAPKTHTRFVDGAERQVCAYTEKDRGLMESVYERFKR